MSRKVDTMSLFDYIASSRELPTGEFGSKRKRVEGSGSKITVFQNEEHPYIPLDIFLGPKLQINEEDIEVYNSMADIASIGISHLHDGLLAQIRHHFTLPHVYQLYSNWGGLSFDPAFKKSFPNEYQANVKCFKELIKLMHDHREAGDTFEIYSCWIGEEHEPKKEALSQIIELDTADSLQSFELKDKRYILFQ
ncbi:MAG: hypothetical protein IKE34_13780 [Paenibacillus sp.]|nr:hypothetical protein [Paenibacillus sp.]